MSKKDPNLPPLEPRAQMKTIELEISEGNSLLFEQESDSSDLICVTTNSDLEDISILILPPEQLTRLADFMKILNVARPTYTPAQVTEQKKQAALSLLRIYIQDAVKKTSSSSIVAFLIEAAAELHEESMEGAPEEHNGRRRDDLFNALCSSMLVAVKTRLQIQKDLNTPCGPSPTNTH